MSRIHGIGDGSSYLSWADLPPHRQQAAVLAANDVMERLAGYAKVDGAPFTEWDLWVLRNPPDSLHGELTRFIADGRTASEAAAYEAKLAWAFETTLSRTVRLIRSAIERDKKAGLAPLVQPRPDLTIPKWWDERYEIIYASEIPWCISGAFQGALLGFPGFGEKNPWRSR